MLLVLSRCWWYYLFDLVKSTVIVLNHKVAKNDVEICLMNVERAQTYIREISLTTIHWEHRSGSLRISQERLGHVISWKAAAIFMRRITIWLKDWTVLIIFNGFMVILIIEMVNCSEEEKIFGREYILVIVTMKRNVFQGVEINSWLIQNIFGSKW